MNKAAVKCSTSLMWVKISIRQEKTERKMSPAGTLLSHQVPAGLCPQVFVCSGQALMLLIQKLL